MRSRVFILWLLVFFSAASLPSASVRASWSNFGTYSAADFYNAHSGLISSNNGKSGLIERFVDSNLSVVFAAPITQIAIQDSNRAWATDGDTLYLGTNQWADWKPVLSQYSLTLVRATPSESATIRGALFVYSDSDLYMTVGDTELSPVYGILHGDSITAMDYISTSILIAVSPSNIYRSTNGGANWTRTQRGMKLAASVFVDTMHHLVFIGGDSVRVSNDSGQTWAAVVPPAEFGIGSFDGQVFGARDCSGTLYITSNAVNGSNSDIMRSQDDGNTFESVGTIPFPPTSGSTMKGWAFDRGSTVFLALNDGIGYLDISSNHDGCDGLIPDSVAYAITVSADTISDTLCARSSEAFNVSVASSICTGVRIDSISVLHSNGMIVKRITPQTLHEDGAAFSLAYSGTGSGTDSIMLRLCFHSLEWGFKEHVDFPVMAYVISPPATLIVTDSLQFGAVLLDTSARSMLHITNSGCSPLRVDSVVSSNPTIFSLSKLLFPFTIKGDSTVQIAITFSPLHAGPSLESLELGTNAGHTFIELEGEGVKEFDAVASESVNQPAFSIFPNPASSMLFVEGASENARCEIIDLLGRTVLSGFLNGQSISIAAVPVGIYVVRCENQTARVILSQK